MYRNAPIHPILRIIYLILRGISWLGVTVFYRRRIILGKENLKFDGPAIIVANHPSTLMDVLNPCVHIRQESFFLANYGLFKHPLSNWLLSRLYCIPVKRREDVTEGEVRNNDAAFEKSFQHLEKNGLLFIAAEGVSWMERWVRPFKTGAARIAFGAETRNNWQLGVKILPVGLSYSAPNLFRSQVIVHFGEPFYASPWAERAAENHEQAVDEFTTNIQQRVRALVLDTRDEAGQIFMEQLETVLQEKFPPSGTTYFAFRKKLIEKNLDNEALKAKTAAYFDALQTAKVSDEGLRLLSDPGINGRQLLNNLFLFLGFPFFLLGYAFWWLPCYLPWWLTRKMKLYVGYDSNVKMLAGLLSFPVALWAAFKVGQFWDGSSFGGWLALVLVILSGLIAEQYMDAAQRWRQYRAAKRLSAELLDQLNSQRTAIIQAALAGW